MGCKCKRKWCRRDAHKRGLCTLHYNRFWRATNPLRYAYQNLKSNCKRRKKELILTLAEFQEWCEITGYIEKKGRGWNDYTIDRKDNSKGYSIDNIQMITKRDNLDKWNNHDKHQVPF